MTSPTQAERKVSQQLQTIAKKLKVMLNKVGESEMGFILLTCEVNRDEGRMNYISTINRKQSIEQLETLLELYKQGMPDIPAHEIN